MAVGLVAGCIPKAWPAIGSGRHTSNGWLFVFLKVVVDKAHNERRLDSESARGSHCTSLWRTFPTAASPSSTSLTLLLGLGCAEASAIVNARGCCDLGFAEWVDLRWVL